MSNFAETEVLNQFDEDTLKDIATHGCVSGCAGNFSYFNVTVDFFDAHENEIEEKLQDVMGDDYLSHFAQQITDMTELKNLIVWAFVELVAADATVWG